MVSNRNHLEPEDNFEAARQAAESDIVEELGPAALEEPDLEELESLETGLGMQEVPLDQAVIDTIATDDTDDNLDVGDDGIIEANAEDADKEIVDNRPQELTESYGTGLQGKPSDRAGTYSPFTHQHLFNNPDPRLTGGDVDANYEQAAVVGDEAVGGTVATPDQDIVEELAAAVGVELDDRSFLRVNDMLEQRDDQRWELDPKSSEDYNDRRDE